MYRTGQKYKIQLDSGITYTGEIIEEDSTCIKITTIRGEELILNKGSIKRAELMNGTGDRDDN